MPYVIVAVLAAVVTALAVPLVRALALRIGAVDQPGGRHVHARATPTLGGLAMLVGVAAGLLVAAQLKAFHPVYFDSTEPLAVGIAGAVI